MTTQQENCPLCDLAPQQLRYEIDRDVLAVDCERCGRFKITTEALIVLRPTQKHLLSAFCRRAVHGRDFVRILSNNIEQLIASLPTYSPPEKLDNLLQLMAERTPGPGEYTQFDSARDYPLLIAPDRNEIEYFTQELLRR